MPTAAENTYIGKAGEELLWKMAKRQLPVDDYKLLCNVQLPPPANGEFDLMVFSQFGLFTVEAKTTGTRKQKSARGREAKLQLERNQTQLEKAVGIHSAHLHCFRLVILWDNASEAPDAEGVAAVGHVLRQIRGRIDPVLAAEDVTKNFRLLRKHARAARG